MKKRLLITALITMILAPAFSLEWGGLFTENAKGTIGDFSHFDTFTVRQSNSLCLWAIVPFDANANWRFSGQISYKYNYDFSLLGKSFTNVADFDLLKFSGSFSIADKKFDLAAGRFYYADATSRVFAQNCDGVNIKYNSLFSNASLYAGFTGLLNAYNVNILNSAGSVDVKNNVLLKIYRQSGAYIPLTLSVNFPSLFLNQALSVQGMAFFDANSYTDSTEMYKGNRYYASVSLQGPIAGPIFYAFNTTFGSKDFKNLMNHTALQFAYVGNNVTVKAGAEYASGKQLIFEPFVGFTSETAYNTIFAPEYSGLLLPGLDVIVNVKQCSFYLNGKYVLGLPEDKLIVRGVDASLKAYFNIFSDLKLDFAAGMYYDINTSGADNLYTANLGLTLSF